MTQSEFAALLLRLGRAWSTRDYDTVCAAFAPDVRYGDPTRYAFAGLGQLRAFFDQTTAANESCVFHAGVFDEAKQLGAAEYTYQGENQYHGLVLIQFHGGLIASWRECQHLDVRPWEEFTASTTCK